MSLLKRLVVAAVSLVALACLAAPITIGVLAGWLHGDSSPEALVVMALIYVALMPAVVVAVIAIFDRFDYHYLPAEGRRRPSKADSRRARAAMKFLSERPTQGEGPGTRRDRRRRGSGE